VSAGSCARKDWRVPTDYTNVLRLQCWYRWWAAVAVTPPAWFGAGLIAGISVATQKAVDTTNKWIGAKPGDTFYQDGPRDFAQAFGHTLPWNDRLEHCSVETQHLGTPGGISRHWEVWRWYED
jgi:hypothetical protein